MSNVDEAPPSAVELQQRLDFETLISELSSRFINLPADQVSREIEDALRLVCDPLGVDLAILWQWSDALPDVIVPSHVYCREGIARPSEPMQQDQYPWTYRQMRAGHQVAVTEPNALPEEAEVDRETCRRFGIKSAMALPLVVGGEPPIGALGLNCLRAERSWPDPLRKQLLQVAQVFTYALARQRTEQRRLESEARLAAGAELAGLAFYEVNFSEGIVHADERFCDLCGVSAGELVGLNLLHYWMRQIHPDDRDRILELRQKLHDGKLERLGAEYRFLHPVHGERWFNHVALVAKRDPAGLTVKSYGVLRDITTSKRADEALRDLSRRLILAHEEERALIARELHDDLTQRLAVLAIDVGRAELAASKGVQAEVLRSVYEELVRLSEDVHSLAYQLHPSVLEELGLVEAMRAECERWSRQGRLAVTMDLEPVSGQVRKEAELCLFRVAQEALNNVARHAGINTANITLRHADGGVLLAIRDEGRGFDQNNPKQERSLGLASMRERMYLASGTLDIDSVPGIGTTVVAWVPDREVEGTLP